MRFQHFPHWTRPVAMEKNQTQQGSQGAANTFQTSLSAQPVVEEPLTRETSTVQEAGDTDLKVPKLVSAASSSSSRMEPLKDDQTEAEKKPLLDPTIHGLVFQLIENSQEQKNRMDRMDDRMTKISQVLAVISQRLTEGKSAKSEVKEGAVTGAGVVRESSEDGTTGSGISSSATPPSAAGSPWVAPLTVAPPQFTGENCREWFHQMEFFYKNMGWEETKCVEHAVQYLRGPALGYWFSEFGTGRRQIPKTWENFKNLMFQRFSNISEVTLLKELRSLEWEGSLDTLSTKFSTILSKGDQPNPAKVAQIFFSRLPYDIAVRIGPREFESWTECKEKARELITGIEAATQIWLAEAPYRAREYYFKSLKNVPSYAALGGGDNQDPVTVSAAKKPSRQQSPVPGSGDPKVPRCGKCKGTGHRTKQCVDLDSPKYRGEGVVCGMCKGVGHFAQGCPNHNTAVARRGKPATDGSPNPKTVLPKPSNKQA